MKTINTIYAILSALLVIAMVFGLCSCGASAPRPGTYRVVSMEEHDINGGTYSVSVNDAVKLTYDIGEVDNQNRLPVTFWAFTKYFTLENGVWTYNDGDTKETIEFSGKTITLIDWNGDEFDSKLYMEMEG